MEYVYAGMWFLVGLILIFRMSKENKVFYFAGGFFILLGGWWLANTIVPNLHMFAGGWGMALRVITGVALLAFCIVFFQDYRKGMAKDKIEEKQVPEQIDSAPKDGGAQS